MAIGGKIGVVMALIGVIVTTSMGVTVWKASAAAETFDRHDKVMRFNEEVSAIYSGYLKLRVMALRFSETGDRAVLLRADEARDEVLKAVENAKQLDGAAAKGEALGELADLSGQYLAQIEPAAVDPAARAERNRLGAAADPIVNRLVEMAREEEAVADAELREAFELLITVAWVTMGLVLIMAVGGKMVLHRVVSKPLAGTTGLIEQVAAGDLSVTVEDAARRDDIGRMRRALQVFLSNALAVKRMEAERAELKVRAEAERRQALLDMASDFERSVGNVVDTVASASTELQASSETLSRTARTTADQSSRVARTAQNSDTNVQTVASASEEMSASIAEIAQQVGQSAQIARDAERKAAETNATVTTLAAAAERIGKVVSLISDIAAQTNLLALNATIEAARAGDAGRGFAVVASEVKSLAEQTARATDEISNQISEVQTATGAAVSAIDGIAATISEINEISATISAAVEEQMAAVREITRNTGDVAAGTAEVSQAISLVQEGASETGAAAEQALGAARELGQQANRLRSEVDGFLATIRAA
jgi:methyl-accepting chemotaxis protein